MHSTQKGQAVWQRFTERARRVVYYAQEEAAHLGESFVSTEHLLLGLVREKDSVACRLLEKMGVSLSRIRSDIERQVPRGEGRLSQDMALTPRAKRAIDLAYDEARQLNNNYIGTEHILLGLIREGEGLAGRVLIRMGLDLDRLRGECAQLHDAEAAHPGEPEKPGRVRRRLYKVLSVVGKPGDELSTVAERATSELSALAAEGWEQASMSHSYDEGAWSILVAVTKVGRVEIEDAADDG
jgi:ATP-dependent Clp protease ATP-binding subunit ClpA